MRRNRKNSIKKERIIMIASSAFVLAALTMTGVYVKDRQEQIKDDGYSVDFESLENNAAEKSNQIAKNQQIQNDSALSYDQNYALNDAQGSAQNNIQGNLQNGTQGSLQNNVQGNGQNGTGSAMENDLDYMPMEEAGSSLVEIPGLTDKEKLADMEGMYGIEGIEDEAPNDSGEKDKEKEETATDKVEVGKTLHFSQTLNRPAEGEILLPYSMEKSIYFPTLDQYKYNPAVIIAAAENETVTVCAEGKVLSIFEDEEIGKAVTLDLGDGYQATYGQLKEIAVEKGSYVNAGEKLGTVAAPTIYYSVEGTNVYFQLTQNGNPVNPEGMFQ